MYISFYGYVYPHKKDTSETVGKKEKEEMMILSWIQIAIYGGHVIRYICGLVRTLQKMFIKNFKAETLVTDVSVVEIAIFLH